jgi:hypothetical protein
MTESNVQGLHQQWLQAYGDFARRYLGRRYPQKPQQTGYVLGFANNSDDDAFEMEVCGKVTLPPMSGAIMAHMARFSKIRMYPSPDVVHGLESLKKFPKHTFNLASLIEAGYPRNVRTNFFKGTDGGDLVLSLTEYLQELTDTSWKLPEFRKSMHGVFSGICVILLDACRSQICDPISSSDEDVVKACDEHFLCVL